MIEINKITILLGQCWYYCPHCKAGNTPIQWGLNTCYFEQCKKEYTLEFTTELSEKILNVLHVYKVRMDTPTESVYIERVPTIQSSPSGWKMVPQISVWVKRGSEEHKKLEAELQNYRYNPKLV